MEFLQTNEFVTEINDPTIEHIYALSDLHGDLDAFVIALRDLAHVIQKKPLYSFNENEYDQHMKLILDAEITNDNADDLTYDLGYEWSASNTYVVIVGDMLDNFRKPEVPLQFRRLPYNIESMKKRDNEYIHEEVKLLKFINSLNAQAKLVNSRIIKLIGNHEFENLQNLQNIVNYISPTTYQNSIMGVSRQIYFNKSQNGAKLLQKDGIGAFVKINNFLFTHATILNNTIEAPILSTLTDMNNSLNSWLNGHTSKLHRNFLINPLASNHFLYDRNMADDDMINKLYTHTCHHNTTMQTYCKTLQTFLNAIAKTNEQLRLVVGHCPQNYASVFDGCNTSYVNIVRTTHTSETIGNVIKSGKYDDPVGLIFGMTFGCETLSPDQKPIIYRIDVGVSRAFDQPNYYNNNPTGIIKFFKSKLPQILDIKFDNNDGVITDTTTIIRSKLNNMLIHQPREFLTPASQTILNDYIASATPTPTATPMQITDSVGVTQGGSYNYLEKYHKYKNKYLKLKYKNK